MIENSSHKVRMIDVKDQKDLHMINGRVMMSNVHQDVRTKVTKKARLTISLSEKEATEASTTIVSVRETSIVIHLGAVHTNDLDTKVDKRYQAKTMHQFLAD